MKTYTVTFSRVYEITEGQIKKKGNPDKELDENIENLAWNEFSLDMQCGFVTAEPDSFSAKVSPSVINDFKETQA